jgi:hypothetical protein
MSLLLSLALTRMAIYQALPELLEQQYLNRQFWTILLVCSP